MTIKTLVAIAALACLAIISLACGGTSTNVTVNKPANTTAANTSSTTTTTTSAPSNTTAPSNAETAKTDSAEPNTGVAECDEYIKKYEACLTTIAAKNPQVAPSLKSAFEAQRNGFKTAAASPQAKATLAGTCKQAMETAKTSTAQWCTNW